MSAEVVQWIPTLILVLTNAGVLVWHLSRFNTKMGILEEELKAIRQERSQDSIAMNSLSDRVSQMQGYLTAKGFTLVETP